MTSETMKLLSIIIPSYNMEKYLPGDLRSLVLEDVELLRALDVIVVNDGSKDGTSEIGHRFEREYPDVFRVIDKPNGHYGSCINAGLAAAKGLYVKVMDADDHYDGKGLVRLLRTIQEVSVVQGEPVDAYITDMEWIDETGVAYKRTGSALPPNRILAIEDESVRLDSIIYMHMLAYRTDMLRKIGYRQTQGICFTDNEWIFEPFCAVNKIYYLPEVVYRYLNGREGQSVDQSASLKNLWMFGKLLCSLSERYAHQKGRVSAKVEAYWYLLAYDIACYVYQNEILRAGSEESQKRLLEVDGCLKENWPALYDAMGALRFTRKIPIRFVSLWRRTGGLSSMRMRMFLAFAHRVVAVCARRG